jgi:polysaccharide export outer membrane protein
MRSLLTILLIACPLICIGQETEPLYIQQSDILRISVREEPDISRVVTVRPDGFVAIPLVGHIKVAGLTAQQVQTLAIERLQRFISNPAVTVSIQRRRTFLSALKSIELSTRQSPPLRTSQPVPLRNP